MLEDEFGVKLFVCDLCGVILILEGDKVLVYVEWMMDIMYVLK